MVMKCFEYAVALTGGIATGKSTVSKLLKESGFRMIDADEVAHEIINEEAETIAAHFGDNFVVNGKVDRKVLGALVFSDPEKRKVLESILHPLIYERIKAEAGKLDKRAEPYIVDIPLYYEGGRYAIDKVIVVYAKREQQLQRLMERDDYTKEEALSRIDAQIDIEDKRDNASYIIDNSGNMNQLAFETQRVKDEIIGAYRI